MAQKSGRVNFLTNLKSAFTFNNFPENFKIADKEPSEGQFNNFTTSVEGLQIVFEFENLEISILTSLRTGRFSVGAFQSDFF